MYLVVFFDTFGKDFDSYDLFKTKKAAMEYVYSVLNVDDPPAELKKWFVNKDIMMYYYKVASNDDKYRKVLITKLDKKEN